MDFNHLFDLNTIVGKIATGTVIGLGKIAYNESKAYFTRVYKRRQSLLKNWIRSGVKLDSQSIKFKKSQSTYGIKPYRNPRGLFAYIFSGNKSQKNSPVSVNNGQFFKKFGKTNINLGLNRLLKKIIFPISAFNKLILPISWDNRNNFGFKEDQRLLKKAIACT